MAEVRAAEEAAQAAVLEVAVLEVEAPVVTGKAADIRNGEKSTPFEKKLVKQLVY